MSRAAKIAAAALLGGLLITLALLHVSSPPVSHMSAPDGTGAEARPAAAPVSGRCRTVTVADAECAEAWEAKRRHFFGQKD